MMSVTFTDIPVCRPPINKTTLAPTSDSCQIFSKLNWDRNYSSYMKMNEINFKYLKLCDLGLHVLDLMKRSLNVNYFSFVSFAHLWRNMNWNLIFSLRSDSVSSKSYLLNVPIRCWKNPAFSMGQHHIVDPNKTQQHEPASEYNTQQQQQQQQQFDYQYS